MSRNALKLIACFSPLALLVACSSGTAGTGGGTTTSTGGSKTTTTSGTTSSTTTGTACQMACTTSNMAAYQKFQGYLLADCACTAASPCTTDCAASCTAGMPNTTAPSAACSTCLTNESTKGLSSTCTVAAGGTCIGDATCAPFVTCAQNCP